jgi:hypothetical protein
MCITPLREVVFRLVTIHHRAMNLITAARHFSGEPVALRNVYFRFVRNLTRINGKCGDHFPQAVSRDLENNLLRSAKLLSSTRRFNVVRRRNEGWSTSNFETKLKTENLCQMSYK